MIDYYEYIRSEQWFDLTKPIRKRNKGVCECCKMRYGSCVHHRTYKNLGNEEPKDLLHVCKYCHTMIHNKGEYFIWHHRRKFLEFYRKEIAKELDPGRDL